MAHATVMGRTISRPKVTDIAGSRETLNLCAVASSAKGTHEGTEESTGDTMGGRSGIAFPHLGLSVGIETRHDEIFKIRERSGRRLRQLNALFPQSKIVWDRRVTKLQFTTFNCRHYARNYSQQLWHGGEGRAEAMLDDRSRILQKMEHAQPFICEPVND